MLSTPATIATARRVLGLTPDELGDLLHVSARTIRHWAVSYTHLTLPTKA